MWPVPVAFIGANPCVTLLDDGTRTGFVSLWEAEWSVHGAGRAALVWRAGDAAVRLLTPDPRLGQWLAGTFSRHFPELDGLPDIAEPVDCEIAGWRVEVDTVRAELRGRDGSTVAASIGGALQTRPAHVPRWRLGDVPWTLTNLLTFCADAALEIDGSPVPGAASVTTAGGRVQSSAFIATHETWSHGDASDGVSAGQLHT